MWSQIENFDLINFFSDVNSLTELTTKRFHVGYTTSSKNHPQQWSWLAVSFLILLTHDRTFLANKGWTLRDASFIWQTQNLEIF